MPTLASQLSQLPACHALTWGGRTSKRPPSIEVCIHPSLILLCARPRAGARGEQELPLSGSSWSSEEGPQAYGGGSMSLG